MVSIMSQQSFITIKIIGFIANNNGHLSLEVVASFCSRAYWHEDLLHHIVFDYPQNSSPILANANKILLIVFQISNARLF